MISVRQVALGGWHGRYQTYDSVLVAPSEIESMLQRAKKGASGTRELKGVGLICPQCLELCFGSLYLFGNFERDKEGRGLQSQDGCK